jgi:hypothetical protein
MPELEFMRTYRPSRAEEQGQLDPRYYAWAADQYNAAERMYAYRAGNEEWENSIRGILDDIQWFLVHKDFPCETVPPDFLRFIQEHARESWNQNVC